MGRFREERFLKLSFFYIPLSFFFFSIIAAADILLSGGVCPAYLEGLEFHYLRTLQSSFVFRGRERVKTRENLYVFS